ncbi:NAD-dependent succinate-semialdehyde dehydrogenase [Telmatospirillum sp. J64-1]|uniref:NAD-dependent succinate-semialdehyde dehydrogenase n=1 Tax=Telmatospirillum sp. J64-1 TaxID=2502183 RepID=UPI00115EC8E9|nr:NAD-dependent succinate-semialdehyde dehydrogenase [Telmatospirillum sp. J64-1]
MTYDDCGALFRRQAYVGGTWIDADDGQTVTVTNPANGEVIGTVPALGAAEVERAIQSARDGFRLWRDKTASQRAEALRRWHGLILDHRAVLARILTTEQGKPLAEAEAEVDATASFFLWFAEEARRVYGDIVPAPRQGQRILVTKEPVGVCAAITPWNFPLSMIARKAAPAVAAGCSIIIKPAEATPFSALALAVLAEKAGIPAGVFNVVTGPARVVGGTLMDSPVVRKVTFTGSTPIGKLLMRQAADTVKRVSMELGGNAPLIVFEDADLDRAVTGIMQSKFRNAGQTCICSNRIFVQDGIYDAVVEKLVRAIEALRIGNGLEEGVTMGPMIDPRAVADVDKLVQDAVTAGASVAKGGKRHPQGDSFYEPTLLTDVTPSMSVASEEIFGPVAPIIRFSTEEEVIELANDTPFGLASYFYTQDLARAWRVSGALEYGMVGLNEVAISVVEAPFGGFKESGVGREGSRHGIDEYVEIKYVNMGGL